LSASVPTVMPVMSLLISPLPRLIGPSVRACSSTSGGARRRPAWPQAAAASA
jgi:hypothetical protein